MKSKAIIIVLILGAIWMTGKCKAAVEYEKYAAEVEQKMDANQQVYDQLLQNYYAHSNN